MIRAARTLTLVVLCAAATTFGGGLGWRQGGAAAPLGVAAESTATTRAALGCYAGALQGLADAIDELEARAPATTADFQQVFLPIADAIERLNDHYRFLESRRALLNGLLIEATAETPEAGRLRQRLHETEPYQWEALRMSFRSSFPTALRVFYGQVPEEQVARTAEELLSSPGTGAVGLAKVRQVALEGVQQFGPARAPELCGAYALPALCTRRGELADPRAFDVCLDADFP